MFIYKYIFSRSIKVMYMFRKTKKGRRNRSEWEGMSPVELTRLMANRFARIEVLKMEIKELQRLIDRKTKE